MADHDTRPARTFQILVSREDGRDHTVWASDIEAAAEQGTLPVAMCGTGGCEPRGPHWPTPTACDKCSHHRPKDAVYAGYPSRNHPAGPVQPLRADRHQALAP